MSFLPDDPLPLHQLARHACLSLSHMNLHSNDIKKTTHSIAKMAAVQSNGSPHSMGRKEVAALKQLCSAIHTQ